MEKQKALKFGIVGALGRGRSFRRAIEAVGARVQAICDIEEVGLEHCMNELGAREKYLDYAEMLAYADLDAVIVATPMPLHAEQSIMALEKDLHVLCEVPAAVSIDECRLLLKACQRSRGIYMMSENYIYQRSNILVKQLVREGLFGEVYYAEGEYLHELKDLNEKTPWRRTWQTGIDGITYGTHSLGPILQWMPSDRVARVSCEGSGYHYKDPRGDFYGQDTSTMLAKTVKGALIKIRVDMLSERPHAMTNYQLQGTEGVYESGRGGPCDRAKIWLKKLSDDRKWHDFSLLTDVDVFADRYLPSEWRKLPTEALRAGHGGGDYFVIADFVEAIQHRKPASIGIHEALDMTLPGLISQQSVLQGGAWLNVPDSRDWPATNEEPQLRMRWPEAHLESPPDVQVPQGYSLRQLKTSDTSAYINLMRLAGFSDWTPLRLQDVLKQVLPGGYFVIVNDETQKLVATAIASHRPHKGLPFAGELGWVASDPEHRGRRLGFVASAAATRRLIEVGYRNIYLLTDDFRLPAIRTYLKLGYIPDMYCEGMEERWRGINQNLDNS